ncbi:MAG: hypothetical protein E7211_00630 [Clostridium lundense]|nr:hypothetical protein [Clostridium lundense]
MKKSVDNNIKSIITTNSNKIGYFVKWYVDSDRTKASYEKDIKQCCACEYETALSWLDRKDVKEAIKEYLKSVRELKMLDIYNSMYEKAMKGDKQCADWCEKFFKSDFFGGSKSEIDKILDTLNINE